MGRTERPHTHWVPTGPPVATTIRSRFSVMIRDTVHHTVGAPPQFHGASLHRIRRLGGSSARPRKCSARPATTSEHTTDQHARLQRWSTFRAKRCQAAGIEADRKEVGEGAPRRAQKCHDWACVRVHRLGFESSAALALAGAHAGSLRMTTCS